MKKLIFSVAFIAAMGFVANTNAQEIISQDLVNLKTDVATVTREINTLPPMNVNSNPVIKVPEPTVYTRPYVPFMPPMTTGRTPDTDVKSVDDTRKKKSVLGDLTTIEKSRGDNVFSWADRDAGWSGKEGKVAATEIYDFKSSDKAKGKLKSTKDFHGSSKSNDSTFKSDTNNIQKRQ